MKEMWKRALVLALSMLLLAGCTPAPGTPGGEDAVPWPPAPDTVSPAFRRSLLDFSLNLLREAGEEENPLLSPASVYLALGMTSAGAGGDTHRALREGLSAQDLEDPAFYAACRDYLSILNQPAEGVELALANALWHRQDFPIAPAFLQRNRDFFTATVEGLDFTDDAAADTINGWIREQTRGLIGEAIGDIPETMMLYLINAVYFQGDWAVPFDAGHSYSGAFHAPGGEVESRFMVRQDTLTGLSGADGAQGVLLPYGEGRYRFLALLPPEGMEARDYAQTLAGEGLAALLAGAARQEMQLILPAFEVAYEADLVEPLANLGMAPAFDPQRADLSGMFDEGEWDLYITQVLHKTLFRLDEEGSEAGAVTVVAVEVTGAVIDPPPTLRFDRPFLYGIFDAVTEAPLFLGILDTPGQGD